MDDLRGFNWDHIDDLDEKRLAEALENVIKFKTLSRKLAKRMRQESEREILQLLQQKETSE